MVVSPERSMALSEQPQKRERRQMVNNFFIPIKLYKITA
jgi:hypothetical protein